MASRHSKVQLLVLRLYRSFLTASKNKPGFREHIRQEFRQNAQIPRRDIMHIEYLIRRGERQLKQVQNTQVESFGVLLVKVDHQGLDYFRGDLMFDFAGDRSVKFPQDIAS